MTTMARQTALTSSEIPSVEPSVPQAPSPPAKSAFSPRARKSALAAPDVPEEELGEPISDALAARVAPRARKSALAD